MLEFSSESFKNFVMRLKKGGNSAKGSRWCINSQVAKKFWSLVASRSTSPVDD